MSVLSLGIGVGIGFLAGTVTGWLIRRRKRLRTVDVYVPKHEGDVPW